MSGTAALYRRCCFFASSSRGVTMGTKRLSSSFLSSSSLSSSMGSMAFSSLSSSLSSLVAPKPQGPCFSTTATTSSSSFYSQYEMAPPDPIVGLNEAFAKDPFPQKVNVGVGAYRDDQGLPHVLPCVRAAEAILNEQQLDHEYAGIAGDATFVRLALEFVYGADSLPLQEGRVAGVQTLSGTGGLRVFGELLTRGGHSHIYVPTPTWANHVPIFQNAGLEVRPYAYYHAPTNALQFDALVADFQSMPPQSCVLLHACAHNPTGMDPTMAQWAEMSRIMKERQLLPFFDTAYQGFASGHAEQDAAAVRLFVEEGHCLAVVQSFSKNFGLYGERVGALSVVTRHAEEAARVLSQLKQCIRPMYSNPPRHGALIVSTILQNAHLTAEFVAQCHDMAQRIGSMRRTLRDLLERGSDRKWQHITQQIGMFAYSGLTKEQVIQLRDKHHIYCTLNGRISMAGVTSSNVEYIANAILDVTKES